jgi:hypothetical protein
MSIHAYKIIEIKTENAPTFYPFDEFIQTLFPSLLSQLIDNGQGIITLEMKEIIKAKKNISKIFEDEGKFLSSDDKKIYIGILDEMLADKNKVSFIEYYCY